MFVGDHSEEINGKIDRELFIVAFGNRLRREVKENGKFVTGKRRCDAYRVFQEIIKIDTGMNRRYDPSKRFTPGENYIKIIAGKFKVTPQAIIKKIGQIQDLYSRFKKEWAFE